MTLFRLRIKSAVSKAFASWFALPLVLLVLSVVGVALALQLDGVAQRAASSASIDQGRAIAGPAAAEVFRTDRGGQLTGSARSTLDASVATAIRSTQLLGLAIYRADGQILYSRGAGPFRVDPTTLQQAFAGRAHVTVVGNTTRVVMQLGGPPPALGSPTRPNQAPGTRPAGSLRNSTFVVEVLLPTSAAVRDAAQGFRWLLGGIIFMLSIAAASLLSLRRRLRIHAHEATHDPMTGLGNRALLQSTAALLDGARAALLLMDLDGFKLVNDTLGHATGDELLIQVAKSLQAQGRPTDLLVRLGGDEFAVLVPDVDADAAMKVANRFLDGARRSFEVDGTTITCDASVGVALAPRDGETIGDLLRKADIAMYEAKRSGGGVCLASPGSPDEESFNGPEQAVGRAADSTTDAIRMDSTPQGRDS